MEDEELEELKRKRLQQLKQAAELQQQGIEEEAVREEFEREKRLILRQILTPEARDRLARIKLARPEVAEAIENQLIILAQSGKLREKITDKQLKVILSRIMPKKRDIKIRRRGLY
jgi:programmed cell death protein 5